MGKDMTIFRGATTFYLYQLLDTGKIRKIDAENTTFFVVLSI